MQDTLLPTNEDWLEQLFGSAIEARASDIHLEPTENGLNVRYRIDGILQEHSSFSQYERDSIISRIKVISKLDITEHRLPQDGHCEFTYNNHIYNFRVSSLPNIYGETIVMRIFNREDVLLKLELLGFSQEQLQTVNTIIRASEGMMLVTGPTGSGKTNLIYSILHTLSNAEKNIITLEDPIEYQLINTNQTQINENIGLTFARSMRAAVRQDPNIVMLGEIRDVETAQNAIQAALTGILVFSTFHTFDIPALITRFFEFGISNSIVAQAVRGVIATRLVRKICEHCRTQINTAPVVISELNITLHAVYKGRGCDACKMTGYVGRVGIFEVVNFDPEIIYSIIDQKSALYMYELLKKKGIKSLREMAYEKVAQGITTIDEVVRVLGVKS